MIHTIKCELECPLLASLTSTTGGHISPTSIDICITDGKPSFISNL